MYKYFFLYFFVVLSANAKVAYLPVTENFLTNPFYPDTRRIHVIDLEQGQVIKKMDIGSGVGAVFVSNDSIKVYAGVEYENKIVEIDAKTLSVSRTWNNLPVEPTFLMLNPNNDKIIIFGQFTTSAYQIDLNTGAVSEVFSNLFSSSKIYSYTTDLKYLAVYENLNQHLTVLNLDDMSVHSEVSNIGRIFQFSISLSGEELYYYDVDEGSFMAKYTADGSVKWMSTPTDLPPGISPNMFIPSVNSDGSIFAANWVQSYEFQADSGAFNILSDRGASDYFYTDLYQFETTGDNEKIAVTEAIVGCITGWCSVGGNLTVRSVNFNTGTDTLLFMDDSYGSGSAAVGRFLGDLLFEPPIVPVFSYKLSIVLYLIMIWVVAYYFYRKNSVGMT